LAEGAISPIEACKTCVITLAERGIISSICSKNNFEPAKAALSDIGVWDYFVFPRIEFAPKGQIIAALIEEMNLRPENVLFIDDNPLNLEEAKHYAPGLMVADPAVILPVLLDLPQLIGKDDRELSRLQQYKRLEVKSLERAKSVVSNEEFLRECGIQVTIDHDHESNFDRIVEMANRTNQLNFTKKRLETPEAVEEFRTLCNKHGISVGVVRVVDKYGDYGVVGYYVQFRHQRGNDLLHFAFSCRTMNMGIEQYVYEFLSEPTIEIVQPVSNPIKCFDKVDWIKEGKLGFEGFDKAKESGGLVLLGGCELLQLATLCGNRRTEFVNMIRKGTDIRFDEAGFILTDRKVLARDHPFKKLNYWNYEDAIAFDDAVKASQIIITSLAGVFWWTYFVSNRGTVFRPVTSALKQRLNNGGTWFVHNFRYKPVAVPERIKLLERSLDRIADMSPSTCHRFSLGLNTGGVAKTVPGYKTRLEYNEILKSYCEKRGTFTYVDIASIVDPQDMVNADHYTRRGHKALADFISKCVAGAADKRAAASEADFDEQSDEVVTEAAF
jgi:FkbH-like protein